MRFVESVLVRRTPRAVAGALEDPAGFPEWMPGFVSHEVVAGEAGKPGSRTRMRFLHRGRAMEVVEAIVEADLPARLVTRYEGPGMVNEVVTRLEPVGPAFTRYVTEQSFAGTTWPMRVMIAVAPFLFRRQAKDYLARFVAYAERVIPAPPAPEGWALTTEDLMREMQEGKRSSVGEPELGWARAYERSLLPADAWFPKKGERLELLEDIESEAMTHWAAPYSGSVKCRLRAGERFVAKSDSGPEALAFYCDAERHAELEREIIPESERRSAKYGGCSFVFTVAEANGRFRRVGPG